MHNTPVIITFKAISTSSSKDHNSGFYSYGGIETEVTDVLNLLNMCILETLNRAHDAYNLLWSSS